MLKDSPVEQFSVRDPLSKLHAVLTMGNDPVAEQSTLSTKGLIVLNEHIREIAARSKRK